VKNLKIILTFVSVVIFLGCSKDDDNIPFFYDAIAISDVVIPDEFTRGETVEIIVSYLKPSTCHSFSGFDYGGVGNERTVAVINVVIDTNETQCQDLKENETREESFTFFVGLENSYIFRFWQGKDEQGNNIFLNKEVKVIE